MVKLLLLVVSITLPADHWRPPPDECISAVTCDLNDYFYDLDGDELTFEIIWDNRVMSARAYDGFEYSEWHTFGPIEVRSSRPAQSYPNTPGTQCATFRCTNGIEGIYYWQPYYENGAQVCAPNQLNPCMLDV